MKCKTCGHEIRNIVVFEDLGIEVDFNQQQNGKCFNDLVIPEGWRLLKWNELPTIFAYIQANKLIIRSFFENIDCYKKDYAAGFWALSNGAYLDYNFGPSDSGTWLGVIFCRDLKKEKE